MSLRNANLQAKDNMRKTGLKERELLLGGGEESTVRRRNLQTKAGMTSAAESITESLRRTRQLMVQEVERSTSTLMTFVLKLQRTITAAIRAGMAGKPELVCKAVEEGINQGRFDGDVAPGKGLPLRQPMHDEL
ncbi:hypothetical protein F3Y22_tig00110257pilonHSYRG00091 [Hibiscus syriacus]|uniref:Uncharacterized protein n=1 Tax=Hibiscus syriacus TaxID=106335 RepID=A0A6A3B622_HIBSY|nr:hypothetical protein F3Y22_tig00110257pilonHSYRG00091 [Hibiscus syriacus]